MDFIELFDPSHLQPSVPSQPYEPKPHVSNYAHATGKRFSLVQWNAGGLSSSRYHEFKMWADQQRVDAICVVETRWGLDAEWTDDRWICVHSGVRHFADKANGVLILLSKRLFTAQCVAWRVVLPGRLIHLRLFTTPRNIDLICGYQYVYKPSSIQIQSRLKWWHALSDLIHGIPKRNGLVVTGDFNSQVAPLTGQCGPMEFRWNGRMQTGSQHSDSHELDRIIRDYGLISNTTWDSAQVPSFRDGSHASRIDRVFCSPNMHDALAKKACYIQHAPFLPLDGPVHVPIVCTFRKPLFPPRQPSAHITYQQKIRGRHDWRRRTPTWQSFCSDAQAVIAQLPLGRPRTCSVPLNTFMYR